MAKKSVSESEKQLRSENEELHLRLTEAEETLYAIRNGEVDAIVVSGAQGARIFSLTSAETPYRIMVEEMHEGAATLMADMTIIYCNSQFAELVARPAEQIVGASFSQFIGENEKPAFTRMFKSGLAGKSSGEITWLGPENEVRYFHLSFSPLPPDVTGDVCVIMSDFTERKQAEETLHSHVFLNSVIENSPNALWILDKQGTMTQMNQASRTLFCIQDDEALGKYNIFYDPDFEKQEFRSMIVDVFQKGSNHRFVIQYDSASIRGIDASQRIKLDLDVNISPIIDPLGKVTNAVVQFNDITNRIKNEQKLKESEFKFKNLVWDMPVGVLLQGLRSEILLSNPKALELLGLNEDQLLGKTSFDPDWNVIHEDGSPFPGNTHPVPLALATGLPVRAVVMGVYHPIDGNRVWLLVDALPQLNADGNVEQIVCSFVDISARKQAEEQLLDAEWKFRALFDNGPIGVAYHELIYDNAGKPIDYRFIDANSQYIELTGVDPRGKTVLEAFPGIENDPFDWIGTYAEVVRTGKTINMEQHLIMNDRWYNCVAFPYNKPDQFVVAFFDITKRKVAEEAIRKWNTQFKKLSANAPGLIFQFTRRADGSFFVPVASEGIRVLYGCSPEDVIDDFSPIAKFIFPDDIEKMMLAIENSAKNMTLFNFEYRVQLPGESVKWLQSTSTPEKMEDGTITWYGFNTDITDRKQAEDALFKLTEQLEHIGEMAKIGGWELDIATTQVTYSRETARIHEVDFPYVPPKLSQGNEYYPPDVWPDVQAAVQAAIENGTPYDREWPFITAKGKHIWVRAQCFAVRENGKTIQLRGTFQDITKRKQLEADLVKKMNELLQFQRLTVDRELKMIELKKEVNELLLNSGKEGKYRIVE